MRRRRRAGHPHLAYRRRRPGPRDPRPGDVPGTTTPVDISAGGMGLLITPQEHKRLHLDRGSLIAAWIERKDVSVIVHAEIRRVVTRADGLIRLGVSVELRETSLQRRRAVVKFESLSATIHRIELEVLSRFGRPPAR